ncbi:MAG: cyclic nucleotide-binding domain-containing protein [Desulfovibrionaceae bacterium]|nr:cyclic nucleotide-binding domain-containing protein [Desulfovibrionaceae bacterium]
MPTPPSIADMFDETKWSVNFTRQEIELIASYMSVHAYEPGELIFREGDREHYMAFIVEGCVDILKETSDRTERLLVSLSRSTHFGEMAFVDDEPRSASATARDKTTLLVLSRDNFDCILANQPALGIKMLRNVAKMISQRLRMTTGKLVYFRS